MKRLIVLILALALAACASPLVTPTQAPTQEVVQPTQTPVVIVETVVVTVIPTDMPTEIPSATPLPPPTEVPPTQEPATEPPASTPVSAPAQTESGQFSLDPALGAGWFTTMTLSEKLLALRCQAYKQIDFSVAPADPSITQVDFYYRIEDRASGAIFDWQGPRRMLPDADGNYTLAFSGEDVNPNYRKPNAWLDFQFVGLSKSGGRVGNSEKIVQQVSYMFDCPQ